MHGDGAAGRAPVLLLAQVGLASGLAVVATWLGTSHEERFGTNCGTNPCTTYYEEGWPIPWKTDAPAWLIHASERDAGLFGYGDSGISGDALIFDFAFWLIAFIAPMAMLYALARRVFGRSGGDAVPSSGQGSC